MVCSFFFLVDLFQELKNWLDFVLDSFHLTYAIDKNGYFKILGQIARVIIYVPCF